MRIALIGGAPELPLSICKIATSFSDVQKWPMKIAVKSVAFTIFKARRRQSRRTLEQAVGELRSSLAELPQQCTWFYGIYAETESNNNRFKENKPFSGADNYIRVSTNDFITILTGVQIIGTYLYYK